VDHGKDAATAIASQSAMARLSMRLSIKVEVSVIDLVDMPVVRPVTGSGFFLV
jgi:hypothetical protein